MQATNAEVIEGKQVWGDAYIFWKHYCGGEDSDEYWREVIDTADKLCDKHKGNEFFYALIKTVVDDIEKRYKQSKGR